MVWDGRGGWEGKEGERGEEEAREEGTENENARDEGRQPGDVNVACNVGYVVTTRCGRSSAQAMGALGQRGPAAVFGPTPKNELPLPSVSALF